MGKRSSVANLPPAVRSELEKRLVASGFQHYEAISQELAARGFAIGKSSLHRYGMKLERQVAELRAARLEREDNDGLATQAKPASAPAALTIGERLRYERDLLGLTQSQMAERTSVPNSTYVKYEGDERVPGGKALARLALSGVDIVWVIGGERKGPR